MKACIALAVVFGVFAVAQAMSKEDRNAMKAQIGSTCQTKEGASDDEMARLHKQEEPATHEGKCVIACFMEAVGILQNGKPNLDSSLALASKMHPGSDKAIEVMKKVHSDCDAVSDPDRCEFAFKLSKCAEQSMAAQGVTMDDHM